MKRALMLTTLGFLMVFHAQVFAQESPQHGYLLLADGSRLEGWIARPSADNRFSRVAFSESSTAKPTLYGPAQVMEYRIEDGEKYLSSLSVQAIDVEFDEPVFLQVITEGKLTLLVTAGPIYSLLKDGREYKILRNAELEPTLPSGIREEDYIGERTQNTGTMVQLVSECVSVASKLSTGEYPFEQNARLLANIVNDYNECQGVEYYDYPANRKKVVLEPFAAIGLSFNKPWESRGERQSMKGGPYPRNYVHPLNASLLVQGGLDIWFPFIWDQMALSFRASYGRYQYGGSYYGPLYLGSFDTVSSYLFHEYTSFEFSPSVKFIFGPGMKLNPYVSFGTLYRQNRQISSSTHSVKFPGSLPKPPIENMPLETRSSTTGISLGLGIRMPTPLEWPVRMKLEYRGVLSNHTVVGTGEPLLAANIQEHWISLIISSKPLNLISVR